MPSFPTAAPFRGHRPVKSTFDALKHSFRRPSIGGWVALLCIGQVLLWGSTFALTYKAPEIDSAEQFVWAFSMQNGYWKHPPLPSWIMHALLGLFGPSVALPFVATQVAIVVALALTWRLGCEWMSPQRSLIAMALTSLVSYHNLGGDCFNHNTAMLPFQAATALFFYRATRSGAWHLWVLTGLTAGLSMLVKYVAIFPLAGLLLYFVLDRSLHIRRQWAGAALASLIFAAVLAPHALWLQNTHFLPFQYARSVAQALPGPSASLASLASFTAMQTVRVLPFLIGFAYVFVPFRRRKSPSVASQAEASHSPNGNLAPAMNKSDRLFLLIAALCPLIAPLLFGIATQTELQSRWGANAFLLIGWLTLAQWPGPDNARTLRRTLAVVACMHLVLCVSMTLSKTVLAEYLQIRTRANFPGALLAREAQNTWQAHSTLPLRLVVSDIWLGGNIIANSPQRVAVLIDGHRFKSPWVRDETVTNCGALVLDDLSADPAGHAKPNPVIDSLMARATSTGIWSLPWANARGSGERGPTGSIRWGIIPPASAEGCVLN